MSKPDIPGIVSAWREYLDDLDDWHEVVEGIVPKATGCGPVYDVIPNPIEGRPNEGFAIADMSEVEIAEPHYHTGNETMIYIVINGVGKTILGGQEHRLEPKSTVIIPRMTAHFTIPEKDLVLAVINIPPFNPETVVQCEDSDPSVGFDREQFRGYLS